MVKRKIYVVGGSNNLNVRGGSYGYENWMEGEPCSSIEEADLVLFTGGEDVSPSLYGEEKHPRTYDNPKRDMVEKEAFVKAVNLNKHIIGICRGAQFLCVMSGGILVQDQLNPSFYHDINTHDGKILRITSTHHQAQYPYVMIEDEEYKLIGWSKNMSPYHQGGDQDELYLPEGKEAEIVYYPGTKALGIQGHPEMMYDENHPTIIWLRDLLDKHMNNEL